MKILRAELRKCQGVLCTNQRTLIPQALSACMNIKAPMKVIATSYTQLCNIITFNLFLLKRRHIAFCGVEMDLCMD